jgi:hypothetical protein
MVRVEASGEQTIVRVDCWPSETAQWFVRSSSMAGPRSPFELDWPQRDKDLVSERLRGGGGRKGRVLYLWEDRWFQGRPCVAVLLIHVEGQRLQVSDIRVCSEYKEKPRKATQVTSVLLSCMQEIARAAGQEDGCFDWIFLSKGAAAEAKKRFGDSYGCRVKSGLGTGRGRRERGQVLLELCPPD